MKKNNLKINIIKISFNEIDQRIDNFLFKHFKHVPKNAIYRIIRKGIIRINKKRIKPRYKLKFRDTIRFPLFFQKKEKKKQTYKNVNNFFLLDKYRIYEDDYILIINKPYGISVHGGNNIKFGIIELLRISYPETHYLELVHRLDKDTSGILLIAKKRSILRLLHMQIREKKIEKDYLALVHGKWNNSQKKISVPLLRNNFTKKKRIVVVNENGKFSETYFTIKEKFNSFTLMKIKLITGRTHQIRVHTQYASHPIVFDNRYGDHISDKLLSGCGLNRLFLHAYTLKFTHPNSGKILKIKAPLDTDLNNCLNYLRKKNNK